MAEQNLPVVAKKIWGIVRVVYFMLRKGISSKRKLLLDLNMLMKRGKLAGKAAITNLMTHHHAAAAAAAGGDYEFSCSNTPVFQLIKSHGRRGSTNNHFFACGHTPPTQDDDDAAATIKAVLELLNTDEAAVEASPALPGFSRSPAMVRQLRITDSPFPLRDADHIDSRPVDEAAEQFIRRFYNDLSRQKRSMAE